MNSGRIMLIARKSCQRATDHDQDDSLAAIVLSAMALECFLNEFEDRLRSSQFEREPRHLRDLSFSLTTLEEKRAGIRAKISTIHYFLTEGSKIDWGHPPFQDTKVLIDIRNKLIHRKPERFEYEFENTDRDYEPHNLVKYLVSRSVIDAPHSKVPAQWSPYVICPATARWAYNSTLQTTSALVSILPQGSVFSGTIRFLTKNFQPI